MRLNTFCTFAALGKSKASNTWLSVLCTLSSDGRHLNVKGRIVVYSLGDITNLSSPCLWPLLLVPQRALPCASTAPWSHTVILQFAL